MRRTGAVISFLLALVLLGQAIAGWKWDMDTAEERQKASFRELNTGIELDSGSLSAASAAIRLEYEHLRAEREARARREQAEQEAKERTESEEEIVGVAFLIAGLALWGRTSQLPEPAPKA